MLSKLSHKVRHTLSTLNRKISPGALILMYHRVAEVNSDPWSLSVTPQHFSEHLEVLRHYGNPLQLQQLVNRLDDRQAIDRAVVITFDDGYADNFIHAKPILEQHDIPATAFVTTGGIDQIHEFWWDELDRLLFQPGDLPDLLQLKIQGQPYQWELGAAKHYSKADAQRDRYWKMEKAEDPTPRHALYRSLYGHLRFLSDFERTEQLDEIRCWANAAPLGRPSHRTLSKAEILTLASEELIEIGAHTVTHPFLAQLSIAVQQDEIRHSKASLEQLLKHPVKSFSYPNGSYTSETITAVEAAGFHYACCSIADRVHSKSNRFLLPRVVVSDCDGETFARWISQYF
jgi:peptidoglycan/xylan/chitin deacetylase (PgdA/CDA1 family)